MTAKRAAAPAPASLGKSGRALWRAILADVPQGFQLDHREIALLERACSCADRIADLDALVKKEGLMVDGSKGQRVLHPGIAEARQQKTTMQRLLQALELGEPAEESVGARQARKAAQARWNRQRGIRATKEASNS